MTANSRNTEPLLAPRIDTYALRKLERIRRRIPFAFWLVYDAVIATTLWAAYRSGWHWALIGVAFLVIATFFDAVEFIVKGAETPIFMRLLRGTGAESKRE